SERLSRRADQHMWQDPETGYLRRRISPPNAASGIETTWIELPPGTRMSYNAWATNAYLQQLLMLEGELHLEVGEARYVLQEGDCLDFDVQRPVLFENESKDAVRYLIIIRNG